MNGVKMSISSSMYYSSTASTLASFNKQLSKLYGPLDIKSTAFMLTGGKQEEVITRIGLETGINETPVDNNLSFERYITAENNPNDILFQGTDGNLYNLNFSSGSVSSISEKEWIDENYYGLITEDDDSDRCYDVIDFKQDSAEIINYSFNGTGDGADDFSIDAHYGFGNPDIDSKWGNTVKWVLREVDIANPSTNFFNNVKENSSQYINKNEASNIINKFGYNTYINTLVSKAISSMSYNDNSAKSIANYFKQQAEESERADAEAAEKLRIEEEEKEQAALAEQERLEQEQAEN